MCKQLNLLEVDYFGLEYQDGQKVTVRALFSLRLKVQAYSADNFNGNLEVYIFIQGKNFFL